MTRFFFAGIIFLVTLLTEGVKSQEEDIFITKDEHYPNSEQGDNVIKIKNPFFLFVNREGKSKSLWGRSKNAIETNEIETEKRPLFVFRPFYLAPNPQYSLQPPHPDSKPIFEVRKRRDVTDEAPETGDGKLNVRVKRTHRKCRKCEQGYPVAPVYVQPAVVQPAVVQPAVVQPAYVKPVITQPVYTQPAYVKPVVPQPVYTQPVQSAGCNTCGHGGYGGGGGYSFSQSSSSSSAGSYGKK